MIKVEKNFPNLTVYQREQFGKLEGLYKTLNKKVNVISRKDIDNLYLHHVLHSLSIAKVFSFKKGSKILDIGTGGGFPGIPLAIMFPNVHFVLVDSISKKMMVVEKIINELNLQNIKHLCLRAEKVNDKFDFVVSRAVAPLLKLVNWTKEKISPIHKHENKNGLIALKGGDLNLELKKIKHYKIIEISSFIDEAYFDNKKIVYLPIN